jgi:TolA-binding protein
MGTADLVSCVRCRGLADPITVHRRELRSFAARLPGALVYPLRPGTLVAIVAAAAVTALFSYGGIIGAILAYAVQWAFFFSIIRQTARGATTFEAAELQEEAVDIVFPALRGLIGTVIVWLPAAAWAVFRFSGNPDPAAVATDPVLWILLLAGTVYAPAALMHAAAGGRALEMLNPLFIVSFIVRLGSDYALAVAAIVFLAIVEGGMAFVAALVGMLPVPVLSRVLAQAIDLLAQTGMARVLGVLLFVRGDTLDYGVATDYLEPVLPGAVPRGSPVQATPAAAQPVLATTAVAQPAPEPAAEPAVAAAPAPRPVAAAAPEPDPAAPIGAAVAAGDAARAADLFEAYRGPPGAVPPRALFAIAKAASEAGRHALAARALHAAGTGADDAVAPNALLVLARVYERRLGRAAEARQVLEYLVARWPASDAAAHARSLLSPPAAG